MARVATIVAQIRSVTFKLIKSIVQFLLGPTFANLRDVKSLVNVFTTWLLVALFQSTFTVRASSTET